MSLTDALVALAKVSIRSRRLSAGEWSTTMVAAPSGVSIRSRRLSAGECPEHDRDDPLAGVSIRSRRLSAGEYRMRMLTAGR